jgi:hypothetical protein
MDIPQVEGAGLCGIVSCRRGRVLAVLEGPHHLVKCTQIQIGACVCALALLTLIDFSLVG